MHSHPPKYLLVLLLGFAFAARFWGIGDPARQQGDEVLHVPASGNYYHTGHQTPDHWYHPPLKHLLLHGSIRLLGDDPWGWRARNALFGSLTVLLLFLLGKELVADARVAFFSALFLAIDPVHLASSRSTYEEVPAVLFFLIGLYFVVRYTRGTSESMVMAGFFLGLALATKWYFLFTLPVLFLIALYHGRKEGSWTWHEGVHIALSFSLLPLGVYLLTYLPWFGRGYSLAELVHYQVNIYRELQSLTRESFLARGVLENVSPLAWFTEPVIVVLERAAQANGRSRYLMLMNNFPVLLFAFPAFLYSSWHAWKGKDRSLFLIVAAFLSIYLPFLASSRPFFLYSLLPLLPFAYLVIAFSLVALLDRSKHRDKVYPALIGVLLLWTLYLSPLVLGREVPDAVYGPLLRFGGLFVQNRFL